MKGVTNKGDKMLSTENDGLLGKHRKGDMAIKVYGLKKHEQGIMEVENSLEAGQAFVGGLIEVYPVTDNLDLVCNDEGLINGLEPRAVVLGEGDDGMISMRGVREVIHGDCFVCRSNDEGDFVSIKDEDIKTIRHYVKAVILVRDGVIQIE